MMIQLQLPAGQCVRRCASSAPAKVTRPKVVVRSSATQTTNGVAKEIFDDETKTKLDQLMLRWKTFDTDGNGYIDREELRHLLESTDDGSAVMFTEHWLPEDELDRVMDQYDKDKNGVIDFEEFKEIVYDGLLLDGKLSEYEAAFKAVDSSGNGSIGANELAEVFRSLGNPISYDKLVEVMQHFDKDESGQIEFNEFLLMFRDQLLELKTIQSYMLSVDPDRATSSMMVDAPEGDIALIFSEQEMDDLIAQSAKSGRLMVLFCGLTWCRPCKGMLRPAQRLAENYKDTTTWVKLYGNANRQTKNIFKDRLKIRSTPCFLIYKDGEVVFNMTGSNKEKLEAGLREALGGEEGATRLPRMLYSKGVGYV